MEAELPPPDRPPFPERAAPRSGRLILGACLASFLAFGSVLGTALLIDRPGPAARIAQFWDDRLIRTIADSDLPGTRVLPRATLAGIDPVDHTVTGSIGGAAASRTLFGADLGDAKSLAGLRELWQRTGGTLGVTTIRPVAAIHDRGDGHELHLVAGPFADAADAAELCARLAKLAPTCVPAPFIGQDLGD